MSPSSSPRLFLIDAMGYVFRAFYAPMDRLQAQTPQGLIPTKVPYLFANMVKKLIREQKPDYLGVVFDVVDIVLEGRLVEQRVQVAQGRLRGARERLVLHHHQAGAFLAEKLAVRP